MRHTLLEPSILQWLSDRSALSPETEWIERIDAAHLDPVDGAEGPDPRLLALPPGVRAELEVMCHLREEGCTWSEVASVTGLKSAAGAWKKWHRLLSIARGKKRVDG